jgi:hypothetical protein
MTNDLPLTGYDSLPPGSGESRTRIIDPDGVRMLLDHERHHANRPQIVTMLEHRLASLGSRDAEPSGSDPSAGRPAVAG